MKWYRREMKRYFLVDFQRKTVQIRHNKAQSLVIQCRQFTNYSHRGFLVLVEDGTMWMETEGVESGWGQEGQKWRMVFQSQFVWPKGIKWACTLFLAISHTNIADAHSCSSCLLIYFHLCSQVRKFGRVTKSTKRTCPWRVHLFLVDSLISSSTLFQSQTSLSSWYSNNSSLSLLYMMSQHVLCFVTEWNKLSTMKKLE